MDDTDERYLTARAVYERYSICDMTLTRWVNDPRKDFPKPTYFGRFRYWKLADLVAWERRQPVALGRLPVRPHKQQVAEPEAKLIETGAA
jgi:predicted DNA-binding transcriptional regulator AlpA